MLATRRARLRRLHCTAGRTNAEQPAAACLPTTPGLPLIVKDAIVSAGDLIFSSLQPAARFGPPAATHAPSQGQFELDRSFALPLQVAALQRRTAYRTAAPGADIRGGGQHGACASPASAVRGAGVRALPGGRQRARQVRRAVVAGGAGRPGGRLARVPALHRPAALRAAGAAQHYFAVPTLPQHC